MTTPIFVGLEEVNGEARMSAHPALKRTDAERAAGVTPVNYAWPEGHIERYMTWVDATTDFTTACQAVASVARNKPGIQIQFTPGRTYSVWPSGSGSTLFNLSGAIGVTIEGNGATLSAGSVNSSTPWVFDLLGVVKMQVRNLKYTQSYTTLDSANGAHLFVIRQDSHGITFENCEQFGGRAGIIVLGEFTSDSPRSDQIKAFNCRFTNIYYPQNFQASGDQYFARGIKTINCGRGYFPYNVRQHDVQMYSQHGGAFDDCLLKVYATPGSYNKLEHIKLDYYSDGRSGSGSNQSSGQAIVSFDAQQNSGTSTAAEFSDIDVTVTYEAIASPTTERLVQFRKFTNAGAVDTTSRSHLFANITISGRARSWQNATGPVCIDLFGTTDGYNWTGDTAYNINLRNVVASGNAGQTGIAANGQPFVSASSLTIDNVVTEMIFTRTNWNEQKAFDATNFVSATVVARPSYETFTSIFSSSNANASIGNGSVTGYYTRRGDRIKGHIVIVFGTTTTFGTGEYRATLPVPAASGEGEQIGSLYLLDNGTAHYAGVSRIPDAGSYIFGVTSGVAVTVGAASPFTFAANDLMRFEFDYIAAP